MVKNKIIKIVNINKYIIIKELLFNIKKVL